MIVKKFYIAIFGILVFLFSGCGPENPGEKKALDSTEIVYEVTKVNLPEESESVAEDTDTQEKDIEPVFVAGYTVRQLKEMFRYYLQMYGGCRQDLYPQIKVAAGEDGQVMFLLYEELDD